MPELSDRKGEPPRASSGLRVKWRRRLHKVANPNEGFTQRAAQERRTRNGEADLLRDLEDPSPAQTSGPR